MAIFHDRFNDFRDEIKEILFSDQVNLLSILTINDQFFWRKA